MSENLKFELGGVLLDKYLIERKLGSGGMGVVYLVRDIHSGMRLAVKRALNLTRESRAAVLSELRSWRTVPENPHVLPLRFFRTLDNEILIFTDYMKNGSLTDRIADDGVQTLEDVLDCAIQMAWGLHAAHQSGIVHGDVKPLNTLVTEDGVLKISDFGLAKSSFAGQSRLNSADPFKSISGLAPAYCSPEQAAGMRATIADDVWCWGLSVLELFAERVFWQIGVAANRALDFFLNDAKEFVDRPRIPESVVNVLRKCFEQNPKDRWENMLFVAMELERAHQEHLGKRYIRPNPFFVQHSPERRRRTAKRMTHEGVAWEAGESLLRDLMCQTGYSAKEISSSISRFQTDDDPVYMDLQAYDYAVRILLERIAAGEHEFSEILISVYLDKSLIHKYVGDVHGAIASIDFAIDPLRQWVIETPGSISRARQLASALINKGAICWEANLADSAKESYDEAIDTIERITSLATGNRNSCRTSRYERGLSNDLATAYQNKAMILRQERQSDLALDHYNQAIEIWERLNEDRSDAGLNARIAWAYTNKANLLWDYDKYDEAIAIYQLAIELWERTINQMGHVELANKMAWTYTRLGQTLAKKGDYAPALPYLDRAIVTLEALIQRKGRSDCMPALGEALYEKAQVLLAYGNRGEAFEVCREAESIYETLVQKKGIDYHRDIYTKVKRMIEGLQSRS